MPNRIDEQEHSNRLTSLLGRLIERYRSENERLGRLSSLMEDFASVPGHRSGRIGDRLKGEHDQPPLVEAASTYARPQRVATTGKHVPEEPAPERPDDAHSLLGHAYPKRAYGAPYAPPGSGAPTLSLAHAHTRQAKCGNVVLAAGTGYAAYSADGGNTFIPLNPAATFPHRTGDGRCCEQAAHYLPGIDRFVWLMQFSAGTNAQHCVRLAAASPREIICTKCTGWTYWDIRAAQPGLNKGMKHPEISVRQNVLCVTISQLETAMFVLEIPTEAIQMGIPVHWRLAAQVDCVRSRAGRRHSITG